MSILSGFIKTIRRRLTDDGYIKQSEWTHASSVEFDDGDTLDTFASNLAVKNLIPYPYYYVKSGIMKKTFYGITFVVNEDGTVTVNGKNTHTGTVVFMLNPRLSSQFNGTELFLDKGIYTLSNGVEDSDNNLWYLNLSMYVDGNNENGSQEIKAYTNYKTKSATFEITEDEKLAWVYIGVRAGATIENLTIKPMLVKGKIQKNYDNTLQVNLHQKVSKEDIINDLSTAVAVTDTETPIGCGVIKELSQKMLQIVSFDSSTGTLVTKSYDYTG